MRGRTQGRAFLRLGGLLTAVALATGGCTARPVGGTGTDAPPSPSDHADFAGTVDIGDREMYLEALAGA